MRPKFWIWNWQGASLSMYTLGINAVYHDPAAAIVKDGQVIAAAEEERFTKIKHGKRPVPFSTWELPFNAIDYCLREAGIELTDVDHVAYSYDPFLLLNGHGADADICLPLQPSAHPKPEEWESGWDPLFLSHIANAPRHLAGGVPLHLQARFRGVRWNGPFRWHFVEHHLAHAASAFLASPYNEAAILTLDGRGERATTGYSMGRGNQIERIGQVNMPHSLGILYEQVTDYLGFLHSSDEYKVMALASFGKPAYLHGLPRHHPPGTGTGSTPFVPVNLEERFGPRRIKGGPLEQRHYDIAHSLQVALEEAALEIVEWLHDASQHGQPGDGRRRRAELRDECPHPRPGTVQERVGAACGRRRGHRARRRAVDRCPGTGCRAPRPIAWITLSLGRSTVMKRSRSFCVGRSCLTAGWKTWRKTPPNCWPRTRSSVGFRAGTSSVRVRWAAARYLASPINASMQARLNEIKDREDFRPVAPVVLEEEAAQLVQRRRRRRRSCCLSLMCCPRQPDRIPAVRHVDGTARIQTINRAQNAVYYDLLKAFQRRTGVPVLVNTSFNTRGEPIVLSPRDAVECFWTSPAGCAGDRLVLAESRSLADGSCAFRS